MTFPGPLVLGSHSEQSSQGSPGKDPLSGSLTWLLAELNSSQAVRLSLFREHLTTWELLPPQSSEKEEHEVIGFCSLTMELTSHHFGHLPFIRSKSLGPVNMQGEGITQGMNTRR